jgi:hypothetical protein
LLYANVTERALLEEIMKQGAQFETMALAFLAAVSMLSSKHILLDFGFNYPMMLSLLHIITASIFSIVIAILRCLHMGSEQSHQLSRTGLSYSLLQWSLVHCSGAFAMQAMFHFCSTTTLVMLWVSILLKYADGLANAM